MSEQPGHDLSEPDIDLAQRIDAVPDRDDATVDLGPTDRVPAETVSSTHIRYFGDYEIVREIARGGMGVVFRARQMSLNRTVALKMILAGQLANDTDVQRFRSEAEAAANLDHPGIVPIFEVGQHEGQHYFSMGFVEGQSLSQRLALGPLPVREAAELIRRVSEAIEYAHQRGVIHRDLKPANILLDQDGNPRITDFGLAKTLKCDSGLTGSGQIMGTPSYMPPEQAGGKRGEVGPAADVYALGATLYCVTTGRPPFQAATAMDTVLQVINDEPVPPRRLNALIPRDLETICLKCLEKEPGRRYASATALEADLRRYLDGKPTVARPVTKVERAAKWARRRPAIAALLGVVAAVAALGLGGVLWQWRVAVLARRDAERESERAKAQTELAEQRLYDVRMNFVQRYWEDYDGELLQQGLDEQLPANQGGVDRRGFEWFYWQRTLSSGHITLKGHAGFVLSATFSPDGTRLASAGGDGAVKVWDAATGQQTLTLKGHTSFVTGVAFSPDGKRLASASNDRTVKLWDAATGQEIGTLKGHTSTVNSVAFSPDGRWLGSASYDWTVKLWDAETRTERRTLKGHKSAVSCVVFSPDGKRLASAGGVLIDKPGELKVWDVATGGETVAFKGHSGGVVSVAFSPSGERVASASADGTIKIWDAATGQESRTLRGHAGSVVSVAFSPDGKRLASASNDRTVRVWDAASGQETIVLRAHTKWVSSVSFNADGKRLASASRDGTVKVWDVVTGQDAVTLRGHAGEVMGVAFSPSGNRLASAGADGTVRLWDVASGRDTFTFKGHTGGVVCVAFSPDGRRLASSAGYNGTLKVWDAESGQETRIVHGHNGEAMSDVLSVAFSPDGKRLACAGLGQQVLVLDVASGQEALTLNGHTSSVACVAFSPDGKRIASAGADATVKVWDAATGEETLTFKGHAYWVKTVAFHPDSKRLASASNDQTVKVWDVATGREKFTLKGHSADVQCVAFSPDGTRLASASNDHTVKLWDVATGQETLTLKGHTGFLTSLSFSPDGQWLASASDDGTVKVWDARRPGAEPANSN